MMIGHKRERVLVTDAKDIFERAKRERFHSIAFHQSMREIRKIRPKSTPGEREREREREK
jgi:hypothetical protein